MASPDRRVPMRKMKRVSLGPWLVTIVLASLLSNVAGPGARVAWAAPSATGGVTLDGYGGLYPFGGLSLNTAGRASWNWDIARAITVRGDGSGGWTLDGLGGIHPFGAAAAINSPAYWTWDIARTMVVSSRDAGGQPDGRQGYLLDGYGGVHSWGGPPTPGGAPQPTAVQKGRRLGNNINPHTRAGGGEGNG